MPEKHKLQIKAIVDIIQPSFIKMKEFGNT